MATFLHQNFPDVVDLVDEREKVERQRAILILQEVGGA